MQKEILVIDDSAAMRKILQKVLKQAGIRVRSVMEASDGNEAIELLKTRRVDIIFADLNMPKMDGFRFLTMLKSVEQWRRIPVLVVTTESSQAVVSEAIRLGAAAYVRKPFTAEQIKEKLLGVLEQEEHASPTIDA